MAGDDFPIKNHDSSVRESRVRSWSNLPRYMELKRLHLKQPVFSRNRRGFHQVSITLEWFCRSFMVTMNRLYIQIWSAESLVRSTYHVISCDIILWMPFIWMLKNLRLKVRVISFGCFNHKSTPMVGELPTVSEKSKFFWIIPCFCWWNACDPGDLFDQRRRAKIHAPHGSKVSKSDPKNVNRV